MAVTTYTRYRTDEGFLLTFEPLEETITATETPQGFEVRYLTPDTDPVPPNEFGDNHLFLVHYHRDFCVANDKIITKSDIRQWYNNHDIDQKDNYWIFAATSLIHSGVWLKLGRERFLEDAGGWDTSHVGAVLASKSEFPDEEIAVQAAQSLIDEWNHYLSGDVYGIIKETFDTQKHAVDCDSVWGCVGRSYAQESLAEFV